MRKVFHIVGILSLLTGLVVMGIFTWWMVYPYKVIEVQSPVPISPKTVKAGQVLYFTMNYCKYMNLPAQADKQFLDGVIYSTPSLIVNNAIGCHSIVVGVTIPVELAPETYIMRQILIYQVNPIRTITVTVDSQKFQIIN